MKGFFKGFKYVSQIFGGHCTIVCMDDFVSNIFLQVCDIFIFCRWERTWIANWVSDRCKACCSYWMGWFLCLQTKLGISPFIFYVFFIWLSLTRSDSYLYPDICRWMSFNLLQKPQMGLQIVRKIWRTPQCFHPHQVCLFRLNRPSFWGSFT